MKCQLYDSTKAGAMAADSKMQQLKPSPVKEPVPVKPPCSPAKVTTVLFSPRSNASAVHNKENSAGREQQQQDRATTPPLLLHDGLEDSGYLSLQNTRHEKTLSPSSSPFRCHGRTNPDYSVASLSPLALSREGIVSSTPLKQHSDPNLPILKFQQAVCKELSEGYRKNKKYDWSIISKVAEDHLLDRVIGRHMGLESLDVFASLLSRNMRVILTKILSLLGDSDLISCRQVSKTWKKIISKDSAAEIRCRQAELALQESRNSLSRRCPGLTRDMVETRVVLSCMQTLASSSSPSSSSSSSKSSIGKTKRGVSRFGEFVQAAGALKQHESLRPCRHCGSPAKHWAEMRRATCTRSSCLYDSCTGCHQAFHGSTPCRTVQPRPHFAKVTAHIPGSAQSKKSVRRL